MIFSSFSPVVFIFLGYSIIVPRRTENKENGGDAKEEIKMDHYEMVENLRTKANVTYEEAKAALEASDWDMLDALVLLEGEGKVSGSETGAAYTTREQPKAEAKKKANKGLGSLWAWVKKMFSLGNNNQFVISRKGSELVSMPITVMALLMILFWHFSLIVLFVGLFLGARYSFRGPDINTSVNQAMDKAQNKAASVVKVECQVE